MRYQDYKWDKNHVITQEEIQDFYQTWLKENQLEDNPHNKHEFSWILMKEAFEYVVGYLYLGG